MSCDNLYTSQSFPSLGVTDTTLLYNQVKIINLEKVEVQQDGQVLLESNFIVGFTFQGLQLTINVLRDGQTITNGPQNLEYTQLSPTPSTVDIETDALSFSVVDSEVKKGTHSYSIILTNSTPNFGPIYIQTYAITIKSFSEQIVYSTQSFPVGTPALTVAAGASVSIDLPVGCNPDQFLLIANLNVVFPASTINLLVNILRSDLTSVINGPQTLISFGAVLPGKAQYNFEISALDSTPSESYTLQLINYSADPVQIDSYSFIGQKISGKIGNQQSFPPLGNTDSEFSVSSAIEIPLKFHVKSEKPVQLKFSGSFITTNPTVLFDIVRDGKSINNGKQIFLRRFIGTGAILQAAQNLLVVDRNPCPGKSKYILKLYNIGFTDLTLDYYSFTAQQ